MPAKGQFEDEFYVFMLTDSRKAVKSQWHLRTFDSEVGAKDLILLRSCWIRSPLMCCNLCLNICQARCIAEFWNSNLNPGKSGTQASCSCYGGGRVLNEKWQSNEQIIMVIRSNPYSLLALDASATSSLTHSHCGCSSQFLVLRLYALWGQLNHIVRFDSQHSGPEEVWAEEVEAQNSSRFNKLWDPETLVSLCSIL